VVKFFYKISITLLLFLIFSNSYSQEKQNFNVGVFEGVGGINIFFFPSFDFAYKTTTIRLSPGVLALSGGVSQEICKLFRKNENLKIIGSVYYSISNSSGFYFTNGSDKTDQAQRWIYLAGLRYYKGQRIYFNFQYGLLNSTYSTTFLGNPLSHPIKNSNPYLEAGIGINLLKRYKQLVITN
jgi:hypothetical protein